MSNKYTIDTALEKLIELDYDKSKLDNLNKLILYSTDPKLNHDKIKSINLVDLFKDMNGSYGNHTIKVKIMENLSHYGNKYGKKMSGQEGWLSPYIHYSDNKNPYNTVRFDEFIEHDEYYGGGYYYSCPIMLSDMYILKINEKTYAPFLEYDKKREEDRNDFLRGFNFE